MLDQRDVDAEEIAEFFRSQQLRFFSVGEDAAWYWDDSDY